MKECPQCRAHYDDDMNFCTACGTPLTEVHDETPLTEVRDETPRRPVNRTRVLAAVIAVVAVVTVIAAIVAYQRSNAATYLRVEPAEVVAVKAGGETSVEIDYDGFSWKINHAPGWVNVAQGERGFELVVLPNTTGDDREGTITVQSGHQRAQLVIRQHGQATRLAATDTTLHFGLEGGTRHVAVTGDGVKWAVESPPFATVKTGDAGIDITVPANKDDRRAGEIVISEDTMRVTIAIAQTGKCPTCHAAGTVTCPTCDGKGEVSIMFIPFNCTTCHGHGTIPCATCEGKSIVE